MLSNIITLIFLETYDNISLKLAAPKDINSSSV